MKNNWKIPTVRPDHQIWFRNTIQRYELAFLDSCKSDTKSETGNNLNTKHEKLAQLWFHLEKIHLHSTSGKLITHPGFCLTLDLATTTIGCQQAHKVVSKKANASFKLAKNAVLGVQTTLRGHMMFQFCYKWYFIYAQQVNRGDSKKKNNPIRCNIKPVNDIFLFHELDRLDYDLFSKVNGFEIVLQEKKSLDRNNTR
jgi:ribosomal protein L5